MKRLFFALWPDDDIRNQLLVITRQIAEAEPDVRLVKPSNLHVTLSFLGNVDEETEKRLIECCQDIVSDSFLLTFDRMTCWRKPRILCLLAKPVAEILDLVEQINRRAERVGIKTESRPYKPHITLARKASHPVALSFEKIDWLARDFCLLESVTDENGVDYQVRCRWSLNPAKR